MHLYLSSGSSLRDQTFLDERGYVAYTSDTPYTFTNRTTTIRRGDGAPVTRIIWKTIGSSIIEIGGREMKANDFLRKKGFGWNGRHRVFVGPDGREYKWEIKSTKPRLILNDGTKTPIATFHRHHIGFLSQKRKASLEIAPMADGMADVILTTFIFVEKLRRDQQSSSAAAGAGASASASASAGGGSC